MYKFQAKKYWIIIKKCFFFILDSFKKRNYFVDKKCFWIKFFSGYKNKFLAIIKNF